METKEEHKELKQLLMDELERKAAGRDPKVSENEEEDIQEMFDDLDSNIDKVVHGICDALVVAGGPGTGKTFNVLKRLNEHHKLTEGIDYVIIKGQAAPGGIYKMCYENKTKLILLDDIDEVLKNSFTSCILKGLLDTYDERHVSWEMMKALPNGLPSRFQFTGRVIFITNLRKEDLDTAVASRCLLMSIDLTPQQIYHRMGKILEDFVPTMENLRMPQERVRRLEKAGLVEILTLGDEDYLNGAPSVVKIPLAIRKEAYDLLGQVINQFDQFTLRTLVNAIKFRVAEEDDTRWRREVIKYA